jgi:hypothetical protein
MNGCRDTEVNFWEKVRKTGTCWLWLGAQNDKGYGMFRFDGKVGYAHRYAYQTLVAPIPDGAVIDHVKANGCRNRNCVNPTHLEAVTTDENNRRSRTGLCKRGHPLTSDNVYGAGTPFRRCRICTRVYQRERYNRLKNLTD